MYELPTSVQVNDKEYHITNNGDYRVILDCFTALNDVEISEVERAIASLVIFYEDFDVEDVLELDEDTFKVFLSKMFEFMNCGQADNPAAGTQAKLIDWEADAQLISAGVNKVAGHEIRSVPYLHWWTFMGYFNNIGEGPLATVVGIRNKIKKGKKLEKYEKEFKAENPQYFTWDARTIKEKEDDELLQQLWDFGDG